MNVEENKYQYKNYYIDKFAGKGKKMKKLFCLTLFFIIVLFTSCAFSPKDEIEGYWVSSDKAASVSFDDGVIVVNGKYIGEYSIFDANKIAINVDTSTFDDVYDIALSAEFKIADGILNITDTDYKTYRFYSEQKVKSLMNEKFSQLYDNNSIIGPFISDEISYPDEWEMQSKNPFVVNVTTEELKQNSTEAIKIAETEILGLYKNSVIDDEYIFDCYCNSAVFVDNSVCYEMRIVCEDMVGTVATYAIEPISGKIYKMVEKNIYENYVEQLYEVWNGTIEGSTLLTYI